MNEDDDSVGARSALGTQGTPGIQGTPERPVIGPRTYNGEPLSSANISDWIVAKARQEAAQREAEDRAMRDLLDHRRRGTTSTTCVLSIRLDIDDRAALDRRAALAGIKPTQLARNLIRIGLTTNGTGDLSAALRHVEQAWKEVRGLVP